MAKTSDYMVHANEGPELQSRMHPTLEVKERAYYVQLSTLGSPISIER